MKPFFALLRASILSSFNTNRKKGNQKSAFLMYGLFLLLFFALSFFYHFSIAQSLSYYHLTVNDYLLLTLSAAGGLSFILSIFQMGNTLFGARDFEFLQALPLKERTVILAKFLSVYLLNLMEDIIIVLPGLVFYLILGGEILPFVFGFISMFLVSLIPLLLSSLVGALVSIITSRVKNKTLITIILYLLVFLLIFGFSFALGFSGELNTLSQLSTKVLPYFSLLSWSFTHGQEFYFVFFILLHVLALVLTMVILSLLYHRVNAMVLYHTFHEKYQVGKNTTSLSSKQALDRKETNLLFKNPHYLINSFIGPVMLLFVGVLEIILFSMLKEEEGAGDIMPTMASSIVILMGMMMNGISGSTPYSFSIEGKNIEFLYAYPVSPMEIIKAKLKKGILIPLVMNLFSALVLSVIYTIMMKFDLFTILAFFLLPPLVSTTTAYIGMFCGMRWPKLHYDNAMQLMKNSACGNLTMLFAGGPSLVFAILYLVFSLMAGDNLLLKLIPLIAFVIIYSLAIIILHFKLKEHGENLFRKILER